MEKNRYRTITALVCLTCLALWVWPMAGLAALQEIQVDPTTLTVSEPSGTASFTIKLNSQPTGDVTIGLSTSNSQCTLGAVTAVTLTSANWQAGVSVDVTAVNDSIADGDQTCVVQTAEAVSDDPDYDGTDPANVTVTVEDDDTAGITVTPTTRTVSEPSGSADFTIKLNSQPTGDVTIGLSTSNSQCTLGAVTSVTLTSANWQAGVSVDVTAVNDSIADGAQTCVVQTAAAVSSDDSYNGTDPANVTVTVEDDDTAGITVTPTTLTVSEPSGSASFTIKLNSQPTGNVTIGLSTSNSQCTLGAVTSVVLTSANWQGGVSVDVTAVNDSAADGDQTCVVQTAAAVSSDDSYNGTNPANVTVTVEDDDTAGITVTPTTLTVSEPSGSADFTIKLNSQPSGDVTIGLSTSNSQCTLGAVTSVVLTSANWQAGVSVAVTAVNDSAADGDQTCVVQTAAAVSSDDGYNGKNPSDVTVTVEDDDTAGITVAPTTLTVSEPNGSADLTIKLSSQPTGDVTIGLSTSNSQCTLGAVTSVTLTSASWQAGVTVTVLAVDDRIDDGNKNCVVRTAAAVSADPNYTGKNPADVTVTVRDDDTAGITVAPTALAVSEPKGSASFTIKLNSQPTNNVTIGLSTSNTQCSVGVAAVTLNSTTWLTGEVVLVSAVDDSVVDGDKTCIVQTAAAVSADPKYTGKNPADVTVTVLDDDAAGIQVSPTALTVSEPSGESSFNVRLASQPTADVTVGLSTSNSQCSVGAAAVTLTALNWLAGVNVAVAAVDDSIADGDQPCMVQTAAAVSGDGNYTGVNAADVTVTVKDDDVLAILVYPTLLTVAEPDGSATVRIQLASQPTDDVTIALSTSNGQCGVEPNAVTLTEANWITGQEVTVSAIDDAIDEGDQTCVVLTGAAVSADPLYDGLNALDVTVTVKDDDTGGIVVSPTSLTVSEPDGSAVFSVTLTSEPVAVVTVTLSVLNDECSVSPDVASFRPGDWPAVARITVTAVDDALQDGAQECIVQVQPAVSSDPLYHARDPEDVIVTVLDDDRYYYLTMVVRNWPPIPQAPVLAAINNPGGDGAYQVEWSPVDGATGYLLQEAKDGAFLSAVQVYSGTLTTFDVAGRGAGRTYYRVKAQNEWGFGAWSNVRAADVLWEAEPNDQAPTELNGPLASGLTYFGTMPSSGDSSDYYFVVLPAFGWVELWLDNIPAGQNYELVLRDEHLNAIGYSGQLGNAAEYIGMAVPAAGRYYIQVYNRGGGGSTQPYHLRVVY